MSDAGHTERLNAALEGRYRIERQLGEGGMATVCLADDLRHERKVALKVLKPELAAVVGAERFLAEIKTTANLQHPHILPLFDSGEADKFLFYVMPYVEGESLRERLDREHQLPVDEAVAIASKVAGALRAAHERGVIHRDIKPANILISKGEPLVSDFGIALAVSVGGASRLTETGLSLGTPHYMSPEQATGDLSVGAATDIYALGCVLYEMLVGEPPYTGSTPQAVLGKIVTGEPDPVTKHRRSVPPNVDAAIRKALEKVPADRFVAAADFAGALGDAGFRYGEVGAGARGRAMAAGWGAWNRRSLALAATTALFALLSAWLALRGGPDPLPAPVRRFTLELPPPGILNPTVGTAMAFTGDGESVVVNVATGSGPGGGQLYVRSLSALQMIPIRGTEGAGSFMVSPDGAWLALNDPRQERYARIPMQGGEPVTVVARPGSGGGQRGGSWGDDGFIVYATPPVGGLLRVPATGGVPDTLTTPPEGELHANPYVLPGGETVLFQVGMSDEEARIAALSVRTREYEVLTMGEGPTYARGGFVLFRRGNALWAAGFDAAERSLTSEPAMVLQGVDNRLAYSVSDDGTLVYAEGSLGSESRLAVVDFEGNQEILPLAPRTFEGRGPSWSPDGESVAFASDGQIFVYDVVRNTAPRQLTFEGRNLRPVFSPDGSRIAFSSLREGADGYELFVKDLGRDTEPQALLTLDGDQFVTDWPADTLVVFEHQEGPTSSDLWLLDLSQSGAPEARPYLTSEAFLAAMVVSPDGTLAAYRSDETGVGDIYVRSFPTPGERTAVSQGWGGGGLTPFWSPDGGTLYFTPGQNLPYIAARLQRAPVPAVVSFDSLFVSPAVLATAPGHGLHPLGGRFIIVVDAARSAGNGETRAQRLIVVENFLEELKRLVPN